MTSSSSPQGIDSANCIFGTDSLDRAGDDMGLIKLRKVVILGVMKHISNQLKDILIGKEIGI